MRVTDIMTPDPACCTPDATLPEVARLMVENDCGEILIVNDLESRKLVGVITDRDIVCRAIAQDKNPVRTKASDIMSDSVVTVSEDADVQECCEKMEEHQVRRIPVLDARSRVCGIVAQADIARKVGIRETAEVVKDVSKPGHAGI
ncbi:MAG TPA: CBS domain-containing protein [Gammaproteobacteria bacterium]|jgi:CBS domain-containing protein